MKLFEGMKKEQKMLLGSLAAGIIAAGLGFFVIDDARRRIETSLDPVDVITAAKYIPAFAEIDQTNVTTAKLPKKYVTAAHITAYKEVAGKRTLVPFIAGEPVMINKVADKGDEINTVIPTGMRAVSLSVDKQSAVSYMMSPGDYVDVLLTYELSDDKETVSKTVTLLQSILVVAVGGSIKITDPDQRQEFDTVTLAVTPDDAETMTLGLEKGRINLSLRPIGDRQKIGLQPATIQEIDDNAIIKSVNPNGSSLVPISRPPAVQPTQQGADDGMGRRSIE